jgi:hypothetical protein
VVCLTKKARTPLPGLGGDRVAVSFLWRVLRVGGHWQEHIRGHPLRLWPSIKSVLERRCLSRSLFFLSRLFLCPDALVFRSECKYTRGLLDPILPTSCNVSTRSLILSLFTFDNNVNVCFNHSAQNAYFLSYFSLGFDLLIHPTTHRVLKVVLHSNLPGEVLFGRYARAHWELAFSSSGSSSEVVSESSKVCFAPFFYLTLSLFC